MQYSVSFKWDGNKQNSAASYRIPLILPINKTFICLPVFLYHVVFISHSADEGKTVITLTGRHCIISVPSPVSSWKSWRLISPFSPPQMNTLACRARLLDDASFTWTLQLKLPGHTGQLGLVHIHITLCSAAFPDCFPTRCIILVHSMVGNTLLFSLLDSKPLLYKREGMNMVVWGENFPQTTKPCNTF